MVVDENGLCCRMFLSLSCCILNPASLRRIPIPEETEDEAAETDMELHLEEYFQLLHGLDAPDEERSEEPTKKHLHPFPSPMMSRCFDWTSTFPGDRNVYNFTRSVGGLVHSLYTSQSYKYWE
jgi:hypothetical protein